MVDFEQKLQELRIERAATRVVLTEYCYGCLHRDNFHDEGCWVEGCGCREFLKFITVAVEEMEQEREQAAAVEKQPDLKADVWQVPGKERNLTEGMLMEAIGMAREEKDPGEQAAAELFEEQQKSHAKITVMDTPEPPPSLDLEDPDLKHEERRSREDLGPTFEVVMGSAGTGKTWLMKDRQQKTRGVVLCATTGIAAINLGGTTINALLGYYDTKSLKETFLNGFLQSRLRKLRASGVTRYVIDEVSMFDGNALDLLVRAVDEVNESRVSSYDPEVKITLVGDFAQLPPVKAPFAFNAEMWDRFEENTTTLTEIRRQTEKDFILALQAARRGDGAAALEYFRDRMVTEKQEDFQGPTILAMNEEVDRYNKLKLASCPGEWLSLQNTKEGRQRGEWKNIPDRIDLKTGAQVMVLANRRDIETKEYLYVNGDLGTLEGVDELGEQPYPVVKLHRTGKLQIVQPVQREFLVPTGNTGARKDRFTVEGTITYYPLRLAYASTVHKTQGLSLDRVQVSIANHFFSNPGSVYVALSRARTPDGLRLVGTPDMFIQRCNADPKVKRFL